MTERRDPRDRGEPEATPATLVILATRVFLDTPDPKAQPVFPDATEPRESPARLDPQEFPDTWECPVRTESRDRRENAVRSST